VQRRRRRHITDPVEIGVNDNALGHAEGVVPVVDCEITRGVTEGVGKDFLAPVNFASDSLSVGVEQELAVVEAQPVSGLINALDTIAIELPGSDIGQEEILPVSSTLLAALQILRYVERTGQSTANKVYFLIGLSTVQRPTLSVSLLLVWQLWLASVDLVPFKICRP
jgi:hypothetical protein